MNRKEEASERMLNEIEASQLSNTESKAMVISKFNELCENYQKLQGNYKELTETYISMKKDIEAINKSQEEMKNTISEWKNTVEGIKSRLDEAETSELEDKVGKNSQKEQEKENHSWRTKTG